MVLGNHTLVHLQKLLCRSSLQRKHLRRRNLKPFLQNRVDDTTGLRERVRFDEAEGVVVELSGGREWACAAKEEIQFLRAPHKPQKQTNRQTDRGRKVVRGHTIHCLADDGEVTTTTTSPFTIMHVLTAPTSQEQNTHSPTQHTSTRDVLAPPRTESQSRGRRCGCRRYQTARAECEEPRCGPFAHPSGLQAHIPHTQHMQTEMRKWKKRRTGEHSRVVGA